MTHTIHPGTISHGTLRDRDLIEAFSRELEWQTQAGRSGRSDRTNEQSQLIADAGEWLKQNPEDEDNSGDDHFCDGSELVCELADALDALAPEGMYFGNTEGDGSDFGFWELDQ